MAVEVQAGRELEQAAPSVSRAKRSRGLRFSPWLALGGLVLALGYLLGWLAASYIPPMVGLGVGVTLTGLAVVGLGLSRRWARTPAAPVAAPPARVAPPEVVPSVAVEQPTLWEGTGTILPPAPAAPAQPVAAPVAIARPVARPWLKALAWTLFGLSLLVYAATRFVAIDQFPIYFFTDEAIHPVLGTELISRGFKDGQGKLFPPYFQNGSYWNLSLSVYIHGFTAWLLGKSILVTRGTSALLALSAAVAIALMLRQIFQIRTWWLGILVLGTMPAWFLHSRTAFEVIMMVTFYSWFLLFYLLYRYRSPYFLYPAMLCGAATFYSYSNGQSVMGITGLLLLISDLRYHLKHWRVGVIGAALLVILAVPYVRFRMERPEALVSQLRILDSYLFRAMPVEEKVQTFFTRYGLGLSPQFWFLPSERELIRHRWPGLGNIAVVMLPFWGIGLAVALRHFKSSAHRAVLIATMAAPFGAALADIGVLRVLAFIVPATILISLGIDWLLGWIKWPRAYAAAAIGCFLVLALGSGWMLNEALVNGPRWYDNYGLYGMQWGTKEIFGYLPQYLRENPTKRVHLTPSWANGTEVFERFFIPGERRVIIQNVDAYISERKPLDRNMIFVMTPDERDRANNSQKFKPLQVELVLSYPDRREGFLFTPLAYVDNIDAVFRAEKEARTRPQTAQLTLGGEMVTVNYSTLDSGQIKDMLDGDAFTLGRVREANPALVELIYPTPRPITGLAADFGSMEFGLTVQLFAPDSDTPVTYTQQYRGLPPDPHIDLPFGNPPPLVKRVRIEVKDLNAGDTAKIHIRELALK